MMDDKNKKIDKQTDDKTKKIDKQTCDKKVIQEFSANKSETSK